MGIREFVRRFGGDAKFSVDRFLGIKGETDPEEEDPGLLTRLGNVFLSVPRYLMSTYPIHPDDLAFLREASKDPTHYRKVWGEIRSCSWTLDKLFSSMGMVGGRDKVYGAAQESVAESESTDLSRPKTVQGGAPQKSPAKKKAAEAA